MLFHANEFEQSFSPKTLKKGLRFFEDGKVSLMTRETGGGFYFLIDGFDLHLKKRGEKILAFSCSCDQGDLCSHLGAALFYFQKDTLGISVKKKSGKKTGRKQLNSPVRGDLRNLLSGVAEPGLVDFILEYSDVNALFRENLYAHFTTRSEDKAFMFYILQVKLALEPYLSSDSLGNEQLSEIKYQITLLVNKVKLSLPGYDSTYYIHLAILSELPAIFNLRFLGDESGILELLRQSTAELEDLSAKNGSVNSNDSWFHATLICGSIRNRVGIAAFAFLLARSLSFLTRKEDFLKLNALVNKRRPKSTEPHQFNMITIARLQVAIKEAQLFKKPFPFKQYRETPEFVIAEAGLHFSINKNDKGFAILENFYEDARLDHSTFLVPYLDHIISKAYEKKCFDIELKYLEESMVYGVHLAPKQLKRYWELIPGERRSECIDQLILRIKTHSKEQSLDKLSALLLEDNRPDSLLDEIKKYRNKFPLVHKIALKKLPLFDDKFLAVYAMHLGEALTDAAYDHYHEQIFLTAKKYLDQLPEKNAGQVLDKILEKLGAFSRIHKFIRGSYPQKTTSGNKLRGKQYY